MSDVISLLSANSQQTIPTPLSFRLSWWIFVGRTSPRARSKSFGSWINARAYEKELCARIGNDRVVTLLRREG
jgi:hypothetical protein